MPAGDGPLTGAIGQLHVTVSDIGRSVAFYRDVLGLRCSSRCPDSPWRSSTARVCGSTSGRPSRPSSGRRRSIYFRADSAREAGAELARRGVEFTSEPHVVHRQGDTELWIGFFQDPDGTTLAVMSEEQAQG